MFLIQLNISIFNLLFITNFIIEDNMEQAVKDIMAGFISGWTQVFIMQPFEIVKIRLQTQTPGNAYYNGMIDCFKKIAKEEGLSAFYKGTVSPLIGIGFQASAMFFSYQACKRFFNQFKENPNDRLPYKFIALSAAIASFPTSLVAVIFSIQKKSPVEHSRIRIQIQKGGSTQLYKGSVDAAVSIARNYGFRGFYKGFLPTWGRECLGQILYFITYESIIRASVRKDQKLSEAPLSISLIGGGLAGITFWLFAYPFDYVKTLLQTDSLDRANAKYKGMLNCFKREFAAGGLSTFYKGMGVAFIRAALVNAGAFFSFEGASRMLGKTQHSE